MNHTFTRAIGLLVALVCNILLGPRAQTVEADAIANVTKQVRNVGRSLSSVLPDGPDPNVAIVVAPSLDRAFLYDGEQACEVMGDAVLGLLPDLAENIPGRRIGSLHPALRAQLNPQLKAVERGCSRARRFCDESVAGSGSECTTFIQSGSFGMGGSVAVPGSPDPLYVESMDPALFDENRDVSDAVELARRLSRNHCGMQFASLPSVVSFGLAGAVLKGEGWAFVENSAPAGDCLRIMTPGEAARYVASSDAKRFLLVDSYERVTDESATRWFEMAGFADQPWKTSLRMNPMILFREKDEP